MKIKQYSTITTTSDICEEIILDSEMYCTMRSWWSVHIKMANKYAWCGIDEQLNSGVSMNYLDAIVVVVAGKPPLFRLCPGMV